jgi:hypothetical protein
MARIVRVEEYVAAARRKGPVVDVMATSSRTTGPRASTMSHFAGADVEPVARAAAETGNGAAEARNGASSPGWAYWALPLAALAGLGWYFLSGDHSPRQVAEAPPTSLAGVDAGLPRRGTALSSTPAYLAKAPAGWVSIGSFYDRDVYGRDGERLGTANDFFVGPDGSIVAAIVGVGGFLGLGEKEIAVPFAPTQIARKGDNWHLVIDATKESLQKAPAFDAGNMGRLSPPR